MSFMTSLMGGGISPLHPATLIFDTPVLIMMAVIYIAMKIFKRESKRSDS